MSGQGQHNTDPAVVDACPFDEQGFPAAFAVGALDGDELSGFREHLAGCAICGAALQEFLVVTAQLPLAIDPAAGPTPAAGLRARLLAAVAEDAARELAAATPERVVAAPGPIPFRPSRRLPQAYAAAAVLLLAFGLGLLGWNLSLQREVTEARAERDRAQQALEVTRWQLAATGAGSQVSGEVVYLRDRQQAVLVVNGLPALQAGQVYQVWLVKDGAAPVPETVFLTQTTGIQANLTEYQTLAITIEPGPRGSVAPTTPILVTSTLH